MNWTPLFEPGLVGEERKQAQGDQDIVSQHVVLQGRGVCHQDCSVYHFNFIVSIE
jgi:hypothetical protein